MHHFYICLTILLLLFKGNKLEQQLTANVVSYLLFALQELSLKFRTSQSTYLKHLSSREARSNVFFETPDFTTIDLNENSEDGGFGANEIGSSSATSHQLIENSNKKNNKLNDTVDTFDNFLKPNSAAGYLEESDERIDEYFQKPVSSRMTQQQLLLFEEENTKLAEHREQEVTKIVRSIFDLSDIFKDLAHMVQEQGTVLDRIDYNVEQTQTKVAEGYKQLQKAEIYQRKNRKMVCILVLATFTLFMMILLIFTKF